ncbi:MAG: hypothetical protein IT445_20905 [Phycisphaeraceae bacterium]|nr:hypothetical protein [Phycisphaeraceae bacterium]
MKAAHWLAIVIALMCIPESAYAGTVRGVAFTLTVEQVIDTHQNHIAPYVGDKFYGSLYYSDEFLSRVGRSTLKLQVPGNSGAVSLLDVVFVVHDQIYYAGMDVNYPNAPMIHFKDGDFCGMTYSTHLLLSDSAYLRTHFQYSEADSIKDTFDVGYFLNEPWLISTGSETYAEQELYQVPLPLAVSAGLVLVGMLSARRDRSVRFPRDRART